MKDFSDLSELFSNIFMKVRVEAMRKNKIILRVLGTILFIIGVVLGMALYGVAAWADLESTFYGFEEMSDQRLTTLDCPVLITTSDVSNIGATFKNPNDIAIEFMVRADFSNKGLFRSERSMLKLDANQSTKQEWQVSSEDIDMGSFVFAQVSNYPAQNMPFREATCGIVVLNLPQFTGKQAFTLAMVIIIGGILGGLILWEVSGIPFSGKLLDTTRAMKALGVLVLLGMLVSFQGAWMLGIILFACSVLAIGVILGFYLAE